jgi:hypothetical protein
VSDQPGLGSLTSKKGWVSIGYDRTLWIPCLPAFPQGYDRESFFAEVAELWWEASELPHTQVDVARLSAMLSELHQGIYGKIPCHLAFIHLPDPRLIPLVLYVGIWESTGERDEQLRLLCHADDAEAVERPVADEFATEKLGNGLRVIRYRHLPDGALYAGLGYAWRSDEYETDLLLSASSEDLARLQRAIPDIEEFARATSIIPQSELHG